MCDVGTLSYIAQGFPTWQVLVVDLRCHGESAAAAGGHAAVGPHTVESSARDVLNLLRELRMFPHMLVGHSFGGKVVMSMAHQFGLRLPRPVQVRPVSRLLPWLVCLVDGASSSKFSSRPARCCWGGGTCGGESVPCVMAVWLCLSDLQLMFHIVLLCAVCRRGCWTRCQLRCLLVLVAGLLVQHWTTLVP